VSRSLSHPQQDAHAGMHACERRLPLDAFSKTPRSGNGMPLSTGAHTASKGAKRARRAQRWHSRWPERWYYLTTFRTSRHC
jgi:hypothetical protein